MMTDMMSAAALICSGQESQRHFRMIACSKPQRRPALSSADYISKWSASDGTEGGGEGEHPRICAHLLLQGFADIVAGRGGDGEQYGGPRHAKLPPEAVRLGGNVAEYDFGAWTGTACMGCCGGHAPYDRDIQRALIRNRTTGEDNDNRLAFAYLRPAVHHVAVERYRVKFRYMHTSEAQTVGKTADSVTAQGLCSCQQLCNGWL